ncbi:MAG TPA: hypothetical protein VL200_10970 [Lacunisphaera sp.]|jgi:hypothetical protein|nr:hypothetical protein [Lacunisphaera sp.]
MLERSLGLLDRQRLTLAAAGLALLVAGGRLAVVDRYGTDLPVQDSWAADSRAFIIPFGTGDFNPLTLFYPTNEHRVFFTNLTNALLAGVSGQWDNRQQTVVNAFLCGGVLGSVWLLLARRLPGYGAVVLFLVLMAGGGLPLVYENIVQGFQSQFVYVAGFSVACLWLMLNATPGTRAWHFGWIAGVCAMLSLGSGFVAPLVVLFLTLARLALAKPSDRTPLLTTAAVATLLLVFGWLVRNPAPQHDVLHARTAAQFLRYVMAGMAWPGAAWFCLAPLSYAPLGWLAWRWVRQPSFRDPLPTFLLAGGLWIGLQISAIALTRSNTTMWPPANRYGELYLYGAIFNVAAGVLLASRAVSPAARTAARALLTAVLLVFAAGAAHTTRFALSEWLPEKRAEFREDERIVAAYVRTPERRLFDQAILPYPDAFILANLLDMPAVQRYLPASVRDPAENPSELARMLGRGSSRRSFLSRLASGVANAWPFWISLGAALALAGLASRGIKTASRPDVS